MEKITDSMTFFHGPKLILKMKKAWQFRQLWSSMVNVCVGSWIVQFPKVPYQSAKLPHGKQSALLAQSGNPSAL